MRGPLAQLAEQLTLNQQVRGSIPLRLTSENTHFVNKILAMVYEQNKDPNSSKVYPPEMFN